MSDDQYPNRSAPPSALTRAEEHQLTETLSAAEPLRCPRCGTPLEVGEVPQRPDVAYVRRRVVVTCGGCGVHGSLDRR